VLDACRAGWSTRRGSGCLLVRALYFVLIGWWFSALWISVAWALHATIIGMIVGFWMFDRVPAIVTLAHRGPHDFPSPPAPQQSGGHLWQQGWAAPAGALP
jgi:hypothetical protein